MVQFRPLENHQIEIVTQLMENFYAIDGYPIELQKTKELFQEFIANDNLGKCWLIYSENEIAGYVILTFIFSFEYGGRIAFLDELFIDTSFRGKGIAQKTLEYIDELKDSLQIKLFYLEVEPHNIIAQNLYKKHNFSIHNRWLMKK